TYLTLGAFSASALALRSRSTLASSGTSQGSVVYALFHVAFGYAGAGASSTGRSRATRFAFAIETASRAAAVTFSVVRYRVAANPQQPSTSARTPQPSVSVSTTFTIWCSRVTTKFCRKRAIRASAHDAPADFAALSASIISSFGSHPSKRCTSRASAESGEATVPRGNAETIASAAPAAPACWRNCRRSVIRLHGPGDARVDRVAD